MVSFYLSFKDSRSGQKLDLRDHLIPRGKITLEVSFNGYKPFSRTLTAEQQSNSTPRPRDFPEYEFSLDRV